MPLAHPPIVELVIGAQFATERSADSAKLVLFWDKQLATNYPHVVEAPTVDDEFEKFDDSAVLSPSRLMVRLESLPRIRYQFVNAQQDRLVQLQQSRLIVNWRQKDSAYPRFSVLFQEFQTTFQSWQEFAHTHQVGEVIPNQWELCYVNFIPQGELWESPDDWHQISPLFALPPTGIEPLTIDDRSFQWRLRLPQNAGRITLTAVQARNDAGKLGLQLTILARGPAGSAEEMSHRLLEAHASILKLFDSLASNVAKQYWGMIQP